MDAKKQKAVERLQKEIANLKFDLKKFSKEFDKEPGPLLEWADGAFSAAAKLRVYAIALDALTSKDSKATLQTLREYALERTLSGARTVARSSSACSNIMREETTAAWAGLLDPISGILTED